MTSDFDGNYLLPFAVLGLAMTIGYAVWSWQQAKKRRSGQGTGIRRNRIEEELRAEIAAAKKRAEESREPEEMVLDLPADARAERERIREAAERAERHSGD